MSTPVNLNKVRKAKKRAEARRQSDQNAIAFGRSKAEKDALKAEAALNVRKLDGHKRET